MSQRLVPIGLSLLMLVFGAHVAAQSPVDMERMFGGLSAAYRDSLGVEFERAVVEDLPVDPLVQKALEGAAKGMPEEVVLRAVGDMRARMATVLATMGSASTAELVAGAAVLQSGLPATGVGELREAAGPEGAIVRPLILVAHLVNRGIDPVRALGQVVRLTAAGASDQLWEDIRRETDGVIGRGGDPTERFTAISRAALQKLGGGGR